MTRRDFQLIAGVIADQEGECEYAGDVVGAAAVARVAERMADALATTNPRFDRGRFLRFALPVREAPVK